MQIPDMNRDYMSIELQMKLIEMQISNILNITFMGHNGYSNFNMQKKILYFRISKEIK